MTLSAYGYVHNARDKCVKKEQEMPERQMRYWEFMRNGGAEGHPDNRKRADDLKVETDE